MVQQSKGNQQASRQPFWNTPRYNSQQQQEATGEEGFQFHPRHHQRQPPTRQNPLLLQHVMPFSSSRIPWSPGQPLMSEAPLEDSSRHSDPREIFHEAFWGCLRRWCCCCCQCRRSPSRESDEMLLHHRHEQQGRAANGCYNFLYVLLSLLCFGGLYHYSARCNHQEWTMNAGESRRVATAGFLTDSVQVISHTPSAAARSSNATDTRGMAVYAVGGNQECPLLTGPPVTLKGPSQELVLLHNAFEYQYFYLNKGSTMQVTVHQIKGAANILVLKGSKVLARIQDKRSSSSRTHNFMDSLFSGVSLDFSLEQIMLEQFSWTQQDRGPITFSFTSPSSDVYVLLYDNAAANEPATLEVQYDMVLTTYNLEGLVPWCSHSSSVRTSLSSSSFFPEEKHETSFTCPPLEASTAGCIIVEAMEHHGGDGQRNSTNSSSASTHSNLPLGGGLVEVTMYTTRKWLYIGGLSILPSLLLALIFYCRQTQLRRRIRRYHHDEYYYPVQQQQPGRQEGPNYHYLPPHHHRQDSSDHPETASHHPEGGEDTEGEEGRERQQGSKAGGSTERETMECPCSTTETATRVIPAENIVLLQEQHDSVE